MHKPKNNHVAGRIGIVAGLSMLTLAAGAGARPPHVGNGSVTARGSNRMTLTGRIGGTWRPLRQTTDAGGTYQLSGNGDVSPLGPVQVSGSLHSLGTSQNGGTTGSVTLTGAHGTLTLALSGTGQAGSSAPPPVLTFTVTGATGTYQGQTGIGSAQFTMTPQRRPATIPGRRTPQFIVAAIFSLTFGSSSAVSNAPANTQAGSTGQTSTPRQ